jgi:large subunit ribosomal protein L21
MQLYAVIKSGNHEYRVTPGKVVNVDRLEAEPGQIIEFGEVSEVVRGEEVALGTPLVPGARVRVEVIKHGQKNGVIVFRMKRRRLYKNKNDQAYQYTALRIREIVYGDEVFNKRDADARKQKRIAAVNKPKRTKPPKSAAVADQPVQSVPPKIHAVQQPVAEPVAIPATKKSAPHPPKAGESHNRLPLVAALVALLAVASFFLFRSPAPVPVAEATPVALQDAQPVDRPVDPTQPPD